MQKPREKYKTICDEYGGPSAVFGAFAMGPIAINGLALSLTDNLLSFTMAATSYTLLRASARGYQAGVDSCGVSLKEAITCKMDEHDGSRHVQTSELKAAIEKIAPVLLLTLSLGQPLAYLEDQIYDWIGEYQEEYQQQEPKF